MKTDQNIETIKYFFEKFLKDYDEKKNEKAYRKTLKQISLLIDAYLIYSLVRKNA